MGWSLCQGSNGGGQTGEPCVFSEGYDPYITLPFDVSADNHLIVDYDIANMPTNMSVCGTANGADGYMHLTDYGNALYMGTGAGEYVFGTGTAYLTGRHTFEFNRNGYIYFDNVQGSAITPVATAITIGGRGGYRFYGLIYSVEIKSNSTGDTLMKLVPDEQNGVVGFIDEVSGTFYQYGHRLLYS